MTHTRPLTTVGSIVLRSALAAAIALPLAHPASAAQTTTHSLPPSARFTVAHTNATSAAAAFNKIRSHYRYGVVNKSHFSYPYGVAADALGNVYVTNFEANTISLIKPTLIATSNVISQGLNAPVSAAVDPLGYVFIGNLGNNGYVTKFLNGQPVATITANAAQPYSIAVDQFDDLYLEDFGGIAADDASGNSLFGSEYVSYGVVSVAAGNTNVYGFVNGDYLWGNGSVLVRTDGLQVITGPTGAAAPTGAACGEGLCWYSDSSTNTLWVTNGINPIDTSLPYLPAGVAFDQIHNRVFVADPLNNKVHVYNAKTLAAEKVIS